MLLVVFYGAFMLYLDPWLTCIGLVTMAGHLLLLRGASADAQPI